MTQGHSRKAFDETLGELRRMVTELAETATTQLDQAIRALLTGDGPKASGVIEHDAKADQLQVSIQRHVIKVLALEHPVANDLREVVAAERIAADLERIADHAKGIAKRTIAMGQSVPEQHVQAVERFAGDVQHLLKTVLDHLAKGEGDVAREAWRNDESIDEASSELFLMLLSAMQDGRTPVAVGTHLMFVGKNLERVGDLSTNIAEDIRFMVTGKVSMPRVGDAGPAV